LRPMVRLSVEVVHNLAKVGVEGSNPFARSKVSMHSMAYDGSGKATLALLFRGSAGEACGGKSPTERACSRYIRRSSRNSDAGSTLVMSKWSLARVQAT
jgi:hypothetical protein